MQSRKVEFHIKFLPKRPCPPHKLLGVMLTSEMQTRKVVLKLYLVQYCDKSRNELRIYLVAKETVRTNIAEEMAVLALSYFQLFPKWDSGYASHH